MMAAIRIIAGISCFYFFAFNPMQANLLSAVATHYPLLPQDRATILFEASRADRCQPDIINALGDAYATAKNPVMAAISYGNGVICSPGNALMRLKFGEAIFMMGFDGIDNLKDALRLEPNNPIYKAELERFTKLQLQSR